MTEQKNDALATLGEPTRDVLDISPEATRRRMAAIKQFQAIVRDQLIEDLDYGVIPGTGTKATLLKPGAEKLAKLLNCYDTYEFVERVEDWNKPFFHFLVRCTLVEMSTGTKVSDGLGECNSMESKYRWRWVREADLPKGVDRSAYRSRGGRRTLTEFDFAIEKGETTGTYGKPKEYWNMFADAIKNGTGRAVTRKTKSNKEYPAYEIDVDETFYQVPNPDIYDQVNTLVKMAKKRALVDAALSAGRLSDLFTQDLEDLAKDAAEAEAAMGRATTEPAKPAPEAKTAPATKPAPAAAKEPEAEHTDGGGWGDAPEGAPDWMGGGSAASDANEDQPSEVERMFETLVTRYRYRPDDVYKRLKEKFGVTSIKNVPADKVGDVTAFLSSTLDMAVAKADNKGAKK